MSSHPFRSRLLIAVIGASCALGAALPVDAQVQSQRRGRQPSEAPALFGFGSTRTVSHTYVPRHQRNQPPVSLRQEVVPPTPIMQDGDELIAGEIIYQNSASCDSCGIEVACGVDWSGQCDACASPCGGCGSCQGCGVNGCLVPCPQISARGMEFFGGVQGFKGEPNLGQDGSFGFNAGLNWGFGLPCVYSDALTAQFGVRTVQSNLYDGPLTGNQRDQLFLTGGLFRRVDYGLQGGLVADALYEDWYASMNVAQLRGAVSWVYQGGNELGLIFTTSIQDDTNQAIIAGQQQQITWEALRTYRVFYTHYFGDCCNSSESTWFGGVSGNGDGILGADFWIPVSNNWALTSGFLFMIPSTSAPPQGNIDESWNIGLGLTYYPMGHGPYRQRYTEPLFNVADNGTFLIDR